MTGWITGLLFSLLPLLIPYGVIRRINLQDKRERWKQLRFVYSAGLFALIACAGFGSWNSLLARLFNWPPLQNILNSLVPPAFFEYGMTLFWVILVNAGLLTAFALVKRLVKIGLQNRELPQDWGELIANEKPFPRYLYWAILNNIYALDDGSFLLRKNLVKVRQTLKYFIRFMTVLYVFAIVALELALFFPADWISYDLLKKVLNATYLWPAISLIIVGECFYYLDGEEEYEESWSKKKDQPRKSPSAVISDLEADYRKIFPGRFVATLNPREQGASPQGKKMPEAGPVLEGIKKGLAAETEINPDYIRHLEAILDGRDVIIGASLYSDFGDYLFRYLNIALASGESVLVICPDAQEMARLRQYMEERLGIINSYHYVWNTEEYRPNLGLEDRDILFATARMVSNAQLFQGRFMERLSTVIIANSTSSMAQDNLLLSLLSFKLSSLKRIKRTPLQYICLAESLPLGIRKALAEALNLPSKLAAGDASPVGAHSKIMLWRYEDLKAPFAQDQLFSDVSPRYLGLAFPLACVALKKGLALVSVFPHGQTPHLQMLDNLNSIKNYLNPYFGSAAVDFDRQLVFNRCNGKNQYAPLVVLDDSLCNLPMVIQRSASLGGNDTSMIHIISRPYLLRDYFYANAEKYLRGESHITMFMPSVADSSRLAVFRLLYELRENGLPEDEIIQRVERLRQDSGSSQKEQAAGEGVAPIREALAYCLKKALGSDAGDAIYSHFTFRKQTKFDVAAKKFREFYLVRYQEGQAIDNLLSEGRLATLKIDGRTYATNFWSDGIYQRHLPGQHLVFAGRAYGIQAIDHGQITLAPGADDCRNPAGYTQIRRYLLDYPAQGGALEQRRHYDVPLCTLLEGFSTRSCKAALTVETLGCYVHPVTGEAFTVMKPFPIDSNEETQKQARRSFSAASLLELNFRYRSAVDTDKVAFLLAIMMNEFMKTWFPYSKDCVAVCPVLKEPAALEEDEVGQHLLKFYPQISLKQPLEDSEKQMRVLIIEDSGTDLGIVETLTDNWQEMFKRMFDNLREYFHWQQNYADQREDNIDNKYLYFGKDSEPECFDFKTLLETLNELAPQQRAETAEPKDSETAKPKDSETAKPKDSETA